jgi:hemolysin III
MLPKKAPSMDRNSYSVSEEWLSAGSHALGFIFALLGITALLFRSQTSSEALISVIYGTSLALMFLSSTVYHAVSEPATKAVLRKIDHTAIYLLIAGSYTPFLLLTVGGQLGVIALIVVWLVGLSGIGFKLTIGHKYPKLGVSTYAFMGWLAVLLIYPIYQSLSAAGFTLLLLGGICYSAGIPLYMLKSRHYSHALWHVFVVVGAACHFFAIYQHVIGVGSLQ